MARKSETEGERTKAAGVEEPCEESAFVAEVGARLSELKQQLLELWEVKVAEVKLSIWRKLFAGIAAVLGAIFVASLLAVAAYLVLAGVAEALSNAFGSRALGAILAGVIALIVIGAALLVLKSVLTKSAARKSRPERSHDDR